MFGFGLIYRRNYYKLWSRKLFFSKFYYNAGDNNLIRLLSLSFLCRSKVANHLFLDGALFLFISTFIV